MSTYTDASAPARNYLTDTSKDISVLANLIISSMSAVGLASSQAYI